MGDVLAKLAVILILGFFVLMGFMLNTAFTRAVAWNNHCHEQGLKLKGWGKNETLHCG